MLLFLNSTLGYTKMKNTLTYSLLALSILGFTGCGDALTKAVEDSEDSSLSSKIDTNADYIQITYSASELRCKSTLDVYKVTDGYKNVTAMLSSDAQSCSKYGREDYKQGTCSESSSYASSTTTCVVSYDFDVALDANIDNTAAEIIYYPAVNEQFCDSQRDILKLNYPSTKAAMKPGFPTCQDLSISGNTNCTQANMAMIGKDLQQTCFISYTRR